MGNKPAIHYCNRLPAERDGESEILTHPTVPDIAYNNETLADTFLTAVEKNGDRPFLGTREYLEDGKRGEYKWKTYKDIYENARGIGSGIQSEKLAPLIEEEISIRFVGVHSKNREEYVTLIQACILYGITVVPLYDTLGPEVIEYILDHTHMSTIFCVKDSLRVFIDLAKAGKQDQLKNLVVFDEIPADLKKEAEEAGLVLYLYEALSSLGKNNLIQPTLPKPEDIYYISYTSGTTGTPKAAMIGHRNMFVQVETAYGVLPIGNQDSSISYLPLAHIAESTVLQVFVRGGGSVGFYSGDPRAIKEDLSILRPTFFPGVPRIYNKFYDAIQAQFRAAQGTKKKIIDRAVAIKTEDFDKTGTVTHGLYDRLVFNKVKNVLGGRVTMMFTAAAPINGDVLKFLKICFGAKFFEIYGQTENSGAATRTHFNDPRIGHIGNVAPGVRIKLEDIPNMNYFSTDKDDEGNALPRGELCIKGDIVFKGYYKDAGKTKEAIDGNGWLHTGDIASLDKTDRIKIIDRKKAIFKLSQGEYVAPEKIENVYVTSRFVSQSWVYGDSLRDFTVGFVVPDEAVLKLEVKEKLGVEGTFDELIARDDVNKLVLEDLQAVGKKGGLKGFEGIRKLHLTTEAFSPENNLLTPTFKMKRNEAKAKYCDIIDKLYGA